MIRFVLYVVAAVDLAALGTALLVLGALYTVRGVRTACRALRAALRPRRGRRRAPRQSARQARLANDPTVILRRLDAEMAHVTPQYVRRLSDCYLIPGEDFR